MKICKLKLKNLNSFRGEQEIDFESGLLSDASLVAITGPTGAGKTTLLDAICVALYGKTPRLSGQGSQNPKHLISHREKEGFAEVIFMANGTRYLVTWSATQGGTPKVQLRYADRDKLITDKLQKGKSLGSSQRTVSEEVESILGLDFDAFRRSVMLAQGEFAAFLKADKEDRRAILEATAGISIYDVLKRTLNEKVGEVKALHAEVVKDIEGIPEASREQVVEAEAVFDRLQSEAEELGTQSRHTQDEKQREEGRKTDFERLQSSKDRQNELTEQQPEIDILQTTLENANRADRLRPEKQTYDTAKSDLENAEKALDTATEEKTETEAQVKTDQTVYDEKEKAYQTISDEHTQKIPHYRNAKLDVARASDQFAEADKLATALADVDKQIDEVSRQFAERQTKCTELQKRITAAQTFLDENPLPLNRQQRLTRATGLLVELGSHEKQLQTEQTNKTNAEESMSSLKQEIKKLSDTHKKRLAEKKEAETALKTAIADLDNIQTAGTREEWNTRKQQAAKAQPIAQKYETTKDDLMESEDRLCELNGTKVELDAKLAQIGAKLASQTEVCQRATAAVQSCEESLKSALLADSANQLRQHLHEGEPCPVCGATEHPGHGVVMESEGEERLQNAESALEHARAEAQAVQNLLQAVKTRQAETQQNKRNTTEQIDECTGEIEELRNGTSRFLEQWQEIYSDTNVSSDWTTDLITEADTAIDVLGKAEQTHTGASYVCETATQQLKNCESDITREKKSLNEAEEQLQSTSNALEELKKSIAATENDFWGLLPETFHGVAPKAAVKQFEDKIEEVAKYQDELKSTEVELNLLNTKIGTDQNRLETLRKDRRDLQAEIEGYRHQGETYLNVVRDKTGGLETEDKINTAIDVLEVGLKAKEDARNEVQQQLQKSRDLLTQKQTAHEIGDAQFKVSAEKLETARLAYFGKLENAGFDSSEAHDKAFRDDEQIRDLTDQIDAHESEQQQLMLEITELRAQFQETPFDPEALGRITAQVKEIEVQLQAKREKIGAQGEIIKGLKDALEKREALGDKLRKALQELERWQRLQNTIPDNKLRDFALEIMFRQMGRIANVQLSYLTSERYQLKVEGIGDLTVIDRWNANEERPVETLSGGESFLTSLALALALADLSRGRAQLNSLFLDEGFGTLDTETLDIAIAALEGLRTQGRSIFLISHIQELTRRLPVKINVRKQGNGSSSVDIRG